MNTNQKYLAQLLYTTQKMLEILKRFKHFNNDLFADDIKIELVSGETRISIQ